MAATALPEGWERSETTSGIPYYLNHNDGTTQWEHPSLSSLLLDGFGEINLFKYATYRTAMKLREVQNRTQLCNVNLPTLEKAFRELGHHREHNNEVLQVVEVESLLSKVYHNAREEGFGGYNYSLLPQWAAKVVRKQQGSKPDLEPELYTDLTLSWILKCYDSGRTGVVKLHSLKIGLVALCHATIQEKYAFIFDLMSSGRDQMSFSNMKLVVQDLLQLPHSVGEGGVFSVHAAHDTANSCWNYSGKKVIEFVSRDEFWRWMKKEPVSLVWLPTLFRLATSETVKHEARCSECKAFPIVGIRYRCLKCTNVDFCQVCYWKQVNTVKNHKITHPTREYCLATTTGDDMRDFAKQVKNKITRKYRRKPPKKTYLDYTIKSNDDMEDEEIGTGESVAFKNVHIRINNLAERLLELEGGSGQVEPDGPIVLVEELERGSAADYVEPRPREEVARVEPQVVVEPDEPVVLVEESEHQQRGSAVENIEARLRAEEMARIEAQARQVAETQNQEMEREVVDLQGKNQELNSEIERLTHLLNQKPKEIKVPFSIPPPPPKIPLQASMFVDTKTQGVNTLPLNEMTSSSETHIPREWSTSLIEEQQELDSILADLLTAFPTQHSTSVFATDLGHELFTAATVIGNKLSALVEEVASTQDL